jgi:pimeloyl-ACP methyl ester carboxylesterase
MKQLIPYAFQVTSILAPELAANAAAELFIRPKRHPIGKNEAGFLSSARIETLQSGRKAYFWGSGPLVIFVHGWESRGSAFYKWIPLFANAGYQVMSWNGPAHGESPGIRTNAVEIAKSLEADLLELGVNIEALVGHSLGGVVVGLLSRRLEVSPNKIVIISSPAQVHGVFQRFQDQLRLSKKARMKFNLRFEIHTGYKIEDVGLATHDLSLKSQALIIHDIEDREVPFSDLEILKKAWSQSRFIATTGLGHRRILRDESVGHQIIEFLANSR